MSTLRKDLISIISVGANNISKVEKLEKLFKQQMLDLIGSDTEKHQLKDDLMRSILNDYKAQLRQEVRKL